MKKTMVYLEEDADKRLRHLAIERVTSMTGLVRQAIAELLERECPPRRRKASAE